MTGELWIAICFVILVAYLYRPVKHYILSYLDREILLIKDSIELAHSSMIDSEAKLSELRAKLEEVKKARDAAIEAANVSINLISRNKTKELELLMDYKRKEMESYLESKILLARKEIKDRLLQDTESIVLKYLSQNTHHLQKDITLAQSIMKTNNDN